MLLAVTLLCVLFAWWHYVDTIRHQRSICEQAIDIELMGIHWRSTQGQQFQGLIGQWAKGLTPDSKIRASFLLPDGNSTDNSTPDAFEKKLITDWSNGGPASNNEVAERTSLIGRPFTFYKAVRASTNICVQCHAALQPSSVTTPVRQLQSGDLIGIAKVVLP
jgi:hypothetical protein